MTHGHTEAAAGVRQEIEKLAPALEAMPGVTIVLNISTASVIWMNAYGLQHLDTTLAELIALGPDYHDVYFNIEDAEDYVPQVRALLERNDPDETVTIFQQVRTGPVGEDGLKGFQWYATGVRIFVQPADDSGVYVIANALPIAAAHYYTPKIERLLAENELLRTGQQRFLQLTRREREVLALVAQDVSAPEISRRLFLSEETIKTHRRNIRRKLGIQNSYELAKFAEAFNLV